MLQDLDSVLLNQRLKELAVAEGIFEAALDPMIVIGAGGIIKQFNRAAEKAFGYAVDEVVGRNVSMIVSLPHKEKHDATSEAIGTACSPTTARIPTRSSPRPTTRCTGRNGQERPV